MAYDQALIAQKLRRWERYLNRYRLPKWEELPDFGLYMEQVLSLLTEYLDYLPPELKEEQFLTAATVNNYVRNGFLPRPVRKKYYRVHLAYLVVICSLRQSLSLSMLHKMIPVGISEEEVARYYNIYVERHRLSAQYFTEQVKLVAGPMLGHGESESPAATESPAELMVSSAIIGTFSRLLAEKILLLDGHTLESEPAEKLT